MIDIKQLKECVDGLELTSCVAIDDGGLTLVEIGGYNLDEELDWLEVGGIPIPEDNEGGE